jgi:hypothetical protein
MTRDYWFPGRWIGGAALILGPLLLLTGTLLRLPFHFFFPQQLAAVAGHHDQMVAAYTAFVAGNVVLWPAVVSLARTIGLTKPGWAAWGGTLVVFGLFERTFHAGIDHLAFQLVERRGLESATEFVADSYQGMHVFQYLSFTILVGWLVLAVGAYRSGALGVVRSIALASMALLPLGVLKGAEPLSVVGTAGLCVAFLPMGFRLLREGPKPGRRTILIASVVAPAVVGVGYLSSLG